MPLFHRHTGQHRPKRKTGDRYTDNTIMRRDVTLASATLMNKKQIRRTPRRQSWMEEAWAFFDTIGELHAASRWVGNGLSRTKLFVAEADRDGTGDVTPADNPPDEAQDAIEELFAGVGQGEMLRRIGVNLDVVGEVYLIRLPKKLDPSSGSNDPEYRWLVASVDEFNYSQGQSRLSMPEDGTKIVLDPEQVTVIRLWSPHPRVAWESDSPVRANLPVLREVQALSQHITATVESRLAGAGVLAIPKSATLPNPNIQAGGNPLHHDAFVDALVQGMITPIADRDNASAYVPIVVSVDDEAIGKLQHLSFWSELSSQVTDMREAALRRFAAGIDLPQELVLGLGDSSHWNAAEIEEQAIKLGIEPIVAAICDALTQQFLWPALRAMKVDNPEGWVVGYSTSELSQRPDRSAEAQELYNNGVLSPEALLRENGFSTTDLPNDDARRKEFARQVVLAKPELISALAPYVGFEGLEDALRDAVQATPDPLEQAQQQANQPPEPMAPVEPGSPTEATAQRAGNISKSQAGGKPGQPTSGNPRPAQQQPSAQKQQQPADGRKPITAHAARLDDAETWSARRNEAIPPTDEGWQIAAIEMVTLRALELAGKRMLTNGSRGLRGKPEARAVYSWDLHTVATEPPANIDKLLDKAFEIATPVLGDTPHLQETVENYCRALIGKRRPHRREYLVEALKQSGCIQSTTTAGEPEKAGQPT